jgi:hypothetical protein
LGYYVAKEFPLVRPVGGMVRVCEFLGYLA